MYSLVTESTCLKAKQILIFLYYWLWAFHLIQCVSLSFGCTDVLTICWNWHPKWGTQPNETGQSRKWYSQLCEPDWFFTCSSTPHRHLNIQGTQLFGINTHIFQGPKSLKLIHTALKELILDLIFSRALCFGYCAWLLNNSVMYKHLQTWWSMMG